jgi:hypothetical protein
MHMRAADSTRFIRLHPPNDGIGRSTEVLLCAPMRSMSLIVALACACAPDAPPPAPPAPPPPPSVDGWQLDGTGTAQLVGAARPFEPPPPGVRRRAYDGAFATLPTFDTLLPAADDVVANFDLGAWSDTDHVAMLFEALLAVDVDGPHSFFLTSDDGSRLLLDGQLLIDNDGLHGPVEVAATAPLSAGLTHLRVEFFEGEGGASLQVEWQPPGGARGPLPDLLLLRAD